MNNLVGTNFLIDETDYRIVDERDVDGVVMVYAEPVRGTWGRCISIRRCPEQFGTPEVA